MSQPSQPFAPKVQQVVGSFSLGQVVAAVPTALKASVTQQLVDKLNNIAADPIIAENIRDNFISYSAILKEGKFKTEDYISAVAYVSYKIMGYNNEEAYSRTFVQRYQNLIAAGKSKKDISAYVSGYHKNKLVNLIMEQSIIPSWVVNQDMFQRALNVQADLMENATSEKVRTDAANSILTHLKKPEANKFQINLGEVENAGMAEMRNALTGLAQAQKKMIESGQMKTIDVAATKLISGNPDDHE